MEQRGKVMSLMMFFRPTGRGWAWRDPSSPLEELWGLDLPLRIAEQSERAKLDAFFIGSWLLVDGGVELGERPFTGAYEPFTLMGALAAKTTRIGLIGTASTTFLHPYDVARQMTSLDWLSKGRVGWNVVTSAGGAEHYGIDLPPRKERYARAQEHLELTNALWDAWEDDAVINDRENARWARRDRIHPVDFEGRHFKVRGQLFLHRSPQGRPVIVQAGQSPAGIEFAARNAEVVYTAQASLDGALAFSREVRGRAAAAGRDPDVIRILCGVMPTVAPTAAEARAIEQHLDDYVPVDDAARARVADLLRADLDGLDLDEPIPAERLVPPEKADVEGFGSRYRSFYHIAVHDRLPLRRIIAVTDRARGHDAPTGSVAEVADLLQEWFEAGACDGYMLSPLSTPEGVDSICQLLVPELQRRGVARTEYHGATLRDYLGLARC